MLAKRRLESNLIVDAERAAFVASALERSVVGLAQLGVAFVAAFERGLLADPLMRGLDVIAFRIAADPSTGLIVAKSPVWSWRGRDDTIKMIVG